MPLDAGDACDLADVALWSLQDTFTHHDHRPSDSQWAAIRDLLAHLQRAADGTLEPAVYLSAIPAGTGKSQSLVAFTAALVSDPRYANTGVLVACNRVQEVHDMAQHLAAHRDRLHIRVAQANHETLALGDHTTADGAQVIIATQENLRRTLRDAPDFGAVAHLHYLGARRAVVAWDESIAFHRPVVLDAGRMGALADVVMRQSNAGGAYDAMTEWMRTLRSAHAGLCAVPDFAALGLDFGQLEDAADADDDVALQARALGLLSGGRGYMLVDNSQTRRMVTHFPELPATMLPVIVTDASAAEGVHRVQYAQMAETRPVRWLRQAEKTYSNLTLRIVPVSASRAVYRDPRKPGGRGLIDMAVRYIRSVGTDPVLVISYKRPMRGLGNRTITAAINGYLTPDERSRVRHLTWGAHTATNEFTGFRRVLVMGLNFRPHEAAHAASAAALDRSMQTEAPEDHPTATQVEDMHNGMLRDTTMQGLLRGHARMGMDGDCGAMEAVIPQTAHSGLSWDAYRQMFPGVSIMTDTTLMPPKALRGKSKAFAEVVQRYLDVGASEVSNPQLRTELDMNPQAYSKLLKRDDVLEWLTTRGIIVTRLKGRMEGLRKLPL